MKNDSRLENGVKSSAKPRKPGPQAKVSQISETANGDVKVSDQPSKMQHSLQNGNPKQFLEAKASPNLLQVPSHASPSSPSNSRSHSALSSRDPPALPQHQPQQQNPEPVTLESLSLGLKEVTDSYRKLYLKELFKVIRRNMIAIVIGTLVVGAGLAMMIISGMAIVETVKEESQKPGYSESKARQQISMTESVFEKLGAILAGIGSFINMVSIVFILDRRAVLNRDRVEQIEMYKKNRKQPRNIFEILLANAKLHGAGAAEPDANKPAGSGVVVNVTETKETKTTGVGSDGTKTPALANWRKSTAASNSPSLKQKASVAKAMADVTNEKLREFSKSKGDNVEVFVVTKHADAHSRPDSRTSMTSSVRRHRHYLETGGLPEGPLQVHRTLEHWLKESVQHTVTQEFATELEADNQTDTVSLSFFSDNGEDDKRVGSPPSSHSGSPRPTFQNFAKRNTSASRRQPRQIKSKMATPRTLPGTKTPARNVFHELISQEKSESQALYSGTAVDRETPLPPPVRVSAHYSRRPPPPPGKATTPRTTPLDSSRSTVVDSKSGKSDEHGVFATASSGKLDSSQARRGNGPSASQSFLPPLHERRQPSDKINRESSVLRLNSGAIKRSDRNSPVFVPKK